MALVELPFLMTHAEEIARAEFDGHLTMLRFTSGWKVFFGTPDLRSGMTDQTLFDEIPAYRRIEDALGFAISCRRIIEWETPDWAKDEED